MIGYLILLQVFVTVIQSFDIDTFRAEQLNLHNQYRAKHGVPPMTLDTKLTEQAQAFAEQQPAKGGELKHCSKVPGCDPEGAGENLFKKDEKDRSNPTKRWYAEINSFNYCHKDDPTQFNRPGHEGEATGHFTQIVWNASVHLGIGYAQNGGKVYVVARYQPAGNVAGKYSSQVMKPSDLTDKYQDNCNGIDGVYSSWSDPGQCTRSCGGGVRLLTKYCNNPKPSLNGKDCEGPNKKLAAEGWCNIDKCEGSKSHLDLQCEARGYVPKAYFFEQCLLHCYQEDTGKYLKVGIVDDGTHCNDDRGVCVLGVCQPMPKYFAPTKPPPTGCSGSITGSYTSTPSSNIWDNIIFTVPNGATNVVITNKDYNAVSIKVGYTRPRSKGYQFGEGSWMNSRVNYYGSYKTTRTVAGVWFTYLRTQTFSTITIAGPVNPTSGYKLALFAQGSSPAKISWNYDA